MKKVLALFMALMLLGPAQARAYWEDTYDRPVVCCEGKSECLVLQMIMMGSFAQFDPEDSLNGRILSAVMPFLLEVDESDMQHFCEEFGVELEALYPFYYTAMGNSLWATILYGDDAADAETKAIHQVLMLFLDPQAAPDAQAQMDVIREEIGDELIARMAEKTGTTVDFIRYLIFSDNWSIAPVPEEETTAKSEEAP